MILTYRYRLLPTKQQHRALEAILESQRQLYNGALEERIDAYRKAKVTRTYFDQSKALTEWWHAWQSAACAPRSARSRGKNVDPAVAAKRASRCGDAMRPRCVNAQTTFMKRAHAWYATTT